MTNDEMETPNTKLQTPNKFQAPNPKLRRRGDDPGVAVSKWADKTWGLVLGDSLELDVWSLGFSPLGYWVIGLLLIRSSILFAQPIAAS